MRLIQIKILVLSHVNKFGFELINGPIYKRTTTSLFKTNLYFNYGTCV